MTSEPIDKKFGLAFTRNWPFRPSEEKKKIKNCGCLALALVLVIRVVVVGLIFVPGCTLVVIW